MFYIQFHIIFVRQVESRFLLISSSFLERSKWIPHPLLQVTCQSAQSGREWRWISSWRAYCCWVSNTYTQAHTNGCKWGGIWRPSQTIFFILRNLEWVAIRKNHMEFSYSSLGAPSWKLPSETPLYLPSITSHSYIELFLWEPPIKCTNLLWWKSGQAPLVDLFWKEIGWVLLRSWERKKFSWSCRRVLGKVLEHDFILTQLLALSVWEPWVGNLSSLSLFGKIRWLDHPDVLQT